MAEGGGEDDAILKSRTTSSSFPSDEYRHDAAFVEEVATVCSEMTGSASYYPPLEAILEHNTKPHHRPASADATTPSYDTFHTSMYRTIRLWHARAVRPFWKLTMAQIFCAIYILLLTFSSPPLGLRDAAGTNNIIDTSSMTNTAAGVIYINGSYRPIVAMTTWQKICLGISRASAFSMYPMLVVVFITKMKALNSFLYTTPLSMYFAVLTNAHEFHVYAGIYLALDVWVHTLFHILRWHAQHNMILLWTSQAGLSGIIAIVAITFVTLPMMMYCCKDKLSYEIRQVLHSLFYIVAIGLCFHVPINAIPNGGYIAPILGMCIILYTFDVCYVYFFMCEKVETPTFVVLPSGVQLTFMASDRFSKAAAITRGGYIYINIPWMSDKQWHPFSLFEDPTNPTRQQIFLLRNGNWSNDIHTSLTQRHTQRPCWIKGPFPSPYTHASSYDNHILVATGVGITPALATIRAYKSNRHIHLIWAVRDDTMLEYFLGHNYFDHNGWTLIYYTGQNKSNLLTTSSAIESISNNNNTNVRIIYGRPALPSIIPNIIYGIESKVGRPEQYTLQSQGVMKKILSDYAIELELDDRCFSPIEKYDMICQLGQDFGFTITIQLKQQQHTMSSNLDVNLGISSEASSSSSLDVSQPLPTPNTVPPLYIRRFSSEIAVKNSSSAENIEQEYDEGVTYEQFVQMRWDSLRTKLRNPSGIDAAWLVPSFCPWIANEEQGRFVKSLDEDVMSTWAVMYCGGSKSVIRDLQGLSIDYNIDVHVDSFAW
jgi:ferric-chelate reductase